MKSSTSGTKPTEVAMSIDPKSISDIIDSCSKARVKTISLKYQGIELQADFHSFLEQETMAIPDADPIQESFKTEAITQSHEEEVRKLVEEQQIIDDPLAYENALIEEFQNRVKE